MRYRIFILALLGLFIIGAAASAETPTFLDVPDTVHPGKAEPITFTAAENSAVTLDVLDANDAVVQIIRSDLRVSAAQMTVTFNGTTPQGSALPQGQYRLRLTDGTQTVFSSFSISTPAPRLIAVSAEKSQIVPGEAPVLSLNAAGAASVNLLLTLPSGSARYGGSYPLQAGENTLVLDGSLFSEGGDYLLSLTPSDENGLSGNTSQIRLAAVPPATPTPVPVIRPSSDADATRPGDFWSMEVGSHDWDAIWQVMISPMTIIRGSGKEAQKQTYRLRAAPDSSAAASNIVGLITCETQGVHVLETLDNGWTYVEAYNSSYGEAYRKAGKGAGYGVIDELLRGYVETDRLETFVPDTSYGLLIDKLEQRLYILTEEGLFTTLMISTGYATASQPWNETPSGEYYLSSKVGDFPSGNLTCGYGMRFNNGDILHEVPHLVNEKYGIKDYSSTERYLGEKASHGCVRVQRKQNEDGVNMKWIWDNVPLRTKLLIWDDSGRPLPYPAEDSLTLYYNPDGGSYYHADQNCASIKNRFLPLKGSVSYAELDGADFQYLKPCKSCNPPARKSEIDALNAANGF